MIAVRYDMGWYEISVVCTLESVGVHELVGGGLPEENLSRGWSLNFEVPALRPNWPSAAGVPLPLLQRLFSTTTRLFSGDVSHTGKGAEEIGGHPFPSVTSLHNDFDF